MPARLPSPWAILLLLGLVAGISWLASLPDSMPPLPVDSAALQSPTALPPSSPTRPIQEATSPRGPTEALGCIQAALGGASTIAEMTSVRILGSTEPTATTRPRPVANEREIGWVFPDRYKRRDVGTARPGLAPLISVSGFNGTALLSDPEPPDEVRAGVMRAVRREFVRQVLMRLPRELGGVRLSQRAVRDAERDRLAIDARDAQGLVATLLAEPRTCLPAALEYALGAERHRIELSGFRTFGGILFPTVLRTSKNGLPWTEERVSEVRVNTAIEDEFFRR